jgi:alanine racemase
LCGRASRQHGAEVLNATLHESGARDDLLQAVQEACTLRIDGIEEEIATLHDPMFGQVKSTLAELYAQLGILSPPSRPGPK